MSNTLSKRNKKHHLLCIVLAVCPRLGYKVTMRILRILESNFCEFRFIVEQAFVCFYSIRVRQCICLALWRRICCFTRIFKIIRLWKYTYVSQEMRTLEVEKEYNEKQQYLFVCTSILDKSDVFFISDNCCDISHRFWSIHQSTNRSSWPHYLIYLKRVSLPKTKCPNLTMESQKLLKHN